MDIILLNTEKETTKISTSLHKGESDLNGFILDQYRRYLSSFALAYNFCYKHRGQLCLKRFKRVSLDEGKLKNMICYIHHNPIHHGFTKDYKSWKYNSYNREIPYQKLWVDYFNGKEDFINYHQNYKLDKAKEFQRNSKS